MELLSEREDNAFKRFMKISGKAVISALAPWLKKSKGLAR